MQLVNSEFVLGEGIDSAWVTTRVLAPATFQNGVVELRNGRVRLLAETGDCPGSRYYRVEVRGTGYQIPANASLLGRCQLPGAWPRGEDDGMRHFYLVDEPAEAAEQALGDSIGTVPAWERQYLKITRAA